MLRLALIGCSENVVDHEFVAARIRRAKFTAVVDRNVALARRVAQAIGAEVWNDNFYRLLEENGTEFDAAVIHHSCDQDLAVLCSTIVGAGKQLFVDNLLDLSKTAATELVVACARDDARTMFGQASRFLPAIQAIKNSLAAGQLGEPGLLRIHRWEPTESTDWNSSSSEGKLRREIDLACWFFGHAPTIVYATSQQSSRSKLSDLEYVQLHLGFADGGMALIDYARKLPPGDGYYSLSLIGSKGAAYGDEHNNMQLLLTGGQPRACPMAIGNWQSNLSMLAQLQEFVAAIEEDRRPLVAGSEILQVIQVTDAAAESLMKHRAFRRCDSYYEPVETS